ncbi:ATP-binding cassette domain-containing protein [Aerococcaceae bacterium DSM 109653]|uniref:ATP-binding cassette domain-containing protein n=1 Tax=Fundicoccus ignavus TaxID=2664442 RepID=A0A844BWL6_9LACT|nr:ABC transporter ATP-binding protein [Fundicoccus ignavus]MRI82049.1 ATP-binding cassette domain-containing protein [Fundicoccus ignavus]
MTNIQQKSTLTRLVQLLFNRKHLLVLSLLGAIIQVALTVYIPVLIGNAINQVIAEGQVNFNNLKPILLRMCIVILLNAFIQWLNPLLYNKMTFETVQGLRQDVLNKLHSVPLNYIDQHSTGDLVSRISTDAEQLSDGINMIFNQFLVGILTIVVTVITMGKLDLVMMFLVVCLTPLSLLVARFIANRSYKYFRYQTLTRGVQSQIVEESIQQGELVRLFNTHEKTTEDFVKANNEYMENSQKAIFYSSITAPTTRFINAMIYAVITFFGAVRILRGTFSVGELTTFLNYANQYTKPFNDISNVLSELQSALACAERLFDVIDQVDEVETGHAKLNDSTIQGKVNFNKVAFSYVEHQPLIEDLTLSVKPGMRVAIVGPTGAGKSTLINLLMRFYDLNSGQILLDDQPTTDFTRESVRAQFGMVLQETWLKSGTIHDNIAYGYPNATRELVIEAAKAAHADHFIRQLPNGYDTLVTDGGDSLAQGQRQLLSIARIFVKVPHMLILDEATSSIDTRTEILIQEAFNSLMEGRTSFVIAHRLSTIQTADLILVMNQGKIIEQGNHHNLMQMKGFYYQMQQTRQSVD